MGYQKVLNGPNIITNESKRIEKVEVKGSPNDLTQPIKRSSNDRIKFEYVDASKYGPVFANIYTFILIHLLYAFSYYIMIFLRPLNTIIFVYIIGIISGLGVTAGAHRLWSHRSYKARLPLRIFLAIAFTLSGQNDLYTWCRDHRVHHKYSETDADPHNSKRGMFFAHMGWLLTKKHPDVIKKGSKLDLSDLWRDPVIRFQRRYFWFLFPFFSIILPVWIPIHFLGESFFRAFFMNILRFMTGLHNTWFVNSAAHMWGDRPYNLEIEPRENIFVSFGALGEGFHNYHHTFPWDYSTSELGFKMNFTKFFLDFMALFGQVYDRKQLSKDLVRSKREKVASLKFVEF